ncbi:MAG: aldo/keto reductase [Phycisphaerae bacterium]
MSNASHETVSRRELLRTATFGAAAVGVGTMVAGSLAAPTASQPAKIFKKPSLPHGKLGRTGFPVTRISFGAIRIAEKLGTRIAKGMIDAGVNLIHTSSSYMGGNSIRAIADLFKADKSYRDRVFLCLKSFNPDSEKEIDEMLRTLGTDHTDALLTTFENADSRRLEAIQKQQKALIKKGKLRHTGFVCHGDMHGVMELIIEKAPRFFEVALLAMRMLPLGKSSISDESKRFVKNLKTFRDNGVGILSMKSGAKSAVEQGADVFLPHVKAVLDAGCDSVLTSVNRFDQIDMIKTLDLKLRHMTDDEKKAAADFFDGRPQACLMCANCRKVCPRKLPVNDLVRIRMYNDEYGWPDHAGSEFARLGLDAKSLALACGDCTTCAQACPIGLARAGIVRDVAKIFS